MQTITVEELKAKIDAGEQLNLLDVREPHEHAAFNIGGQLMPLGLVQALQLDEIEHLKDGLSTPSIYSISALSETMQGKSK